VAVKVKGSKGYPDRTSHLRVTWCVTCQLHGITYCYLPVPFDTSELAPHNPSKTGWYSIYLPLRDWRLNRVRCVCSSVRQR